MSLQLPPYQPLPAPTPGQELLRVAVADLQPTQLCVGLAEVRSRQRDFADESAAQRGKGGDPGIAHRRKMRDAGAPRQG